MRGAWRLGDRCAKHHLNPLEAERADAAFAWRLGEVS
jgi:hypothetical protein